MAAEGAGAAAPGRRALIVEDDPSLLAALTYGLRRRGYDVRAASDGPTGMAEIARLGATLTVVLLDRMLPGQDGFALLAALRADPALARVAVVMTTAFDDPGIRERALALGADAFVPKPFVLADLFATLDSAIAARTR